MLPADGRIAAGPPLLDNPENDTQQPLNIDDNWCIAAKELIQALPLLFSQQANQVLDQR